jgi:hypothetical protein
MHSSSIHSSSKWNQGQDQPTLCRNYLLSTAPVVAWGAVNNDDSGLDLHFSHGCQGDFPPVSLLKKPPTKLNFPHRFQDLLCRTMRPLERILGFVALGFFIAQPTTVFASASPDTHARIYEVNESPGCDARATAMFSTIVPAPCATETRCSEEAGATDSNSLFEFCSHSQAEYLKFAYGDTLYVLLERYEGSNCEDIASTEVFRADGKCHNSLQYALEVTVAANGAVNIRGRSQTCESGEWANVIDSVPEANVNTGACFAIASRSGELYLIDGANATTDSASASGSVFGSTDTNTTTGLLSSASAQLLSSMAMLTALAAAGAVVL